MAGEGAVDPNAFVGTAGGFKDRANACPAAVRTRPMRGSRTVLEAASGLLEEERARLGDDSEGLRDLSGAVEGLTSDLAFLH